MQPVEQRKLPSDLAPLAYGRAAVLVFCGGFMTAVALWIHSGNPPAQFPFLTVLLIGLAWSVTIARLPRSLIARISPWLWLVACGKPRTRVFRTLGVGYFGLMMGSVIPLGAIVKKHAPAYLPVVPLFAALILLVWVWWLCRWRCYITCRRGRIATIRQVRDPHSRMQRWNWTYHGLATPLYTRMSIEIRTGPDRENERYDISATLFAGRFVERICEDPRVILAHEARTARSASSALMQS